jgi:hypothetical protein
VFKIHFTEQNYVNIPNYITYATNYPIGRAYAGSAIIIRKDIKRNQVAKYETDNIQVMNILWRAAETRNIEMRIYGHR